jgi:hypothetical protein
MDDASDEQHIHRPMSMRHFVGSALRSYRSSNGVRALFDDGDWLLATILACSRLSFRS